MMIPEDNSPPTISHLIQETLRLARVHRRETSHLVWDMVKALSPIILILILAFIVWISKELSSSGQSSNSGGSVLGLAFLALIFIVVLIPYMLWLCYFIADIFSEAQQIGLNAVDNVPTIFTIDRRWAVIRLWLLLALPSVIIRMPLKIAHVNDWYVGILFQILLLFFYTALPAVVESGVAMKAIVTSWQLARSNALFIFRCALAAVVPTMIYAVLYIAVKAVASPSTKLIAACIFLFLSFPLLVISIQYEPFYRALVYRSLKPKIEEQSSPLTLPSLSV